MGGGVLFPAWYIVCDGMNDFQHVSDMYWAKNINKIWGLSHLCDLFNIFLKYSVLQDLIWNARLHIWNVNL